MGTDLQLCCEYINLPNYEGCEYINLPNYEGCEYINLPNYEGGEYINLPDLGGFFQILRFSRESMTIW